MDVWTGVGGSVFSAGAGVVDCSLSLSKLIVISVSRSKGVPGIDNGSLS